MRTLFPLSTQNPHNLRTPNGTTQVHNAIIMQELRGILYKIVLPLKKWLKGLSVWALSNLTIHPVQKIRYLITFDNGVNVMYEEVLRGIHINVIDEDTIENGPC